MTDAAPRIPPLPPQEWDPELTDQLGKMLINADGRPLNIFATLAHHPKLLKRWMVFATHVLSKSEISARDRELLILRTGYRCSSAYEWGQHVLIARECGISDAEIERVAEGPGAAGWSAHDAALVRAADELHDTSRISDETWALLAETYTTRQLMEVPFTVGQYHLVAFALNSFGVERDPGVPDLPARH
jgi:4-carboxymuconolactone decarboxylase